MNIEPAALPPSYAVAATGRLRPHRNVSPAGRCAPLEPAALTHGSAAVAEPVELVPPARAPGSASILVLEEISGKAWALFLADARRGAHTDFAAISQAVVT
jgi:hypothetical protein